MSNNDERYFLIHDAHVLMEQYKARNSPQRALSRDQRKLWAAETAAVMRELVRTLESLLPGNASQFSVKSEWNLAMREGRRLATFKVPPKLLHESKKSKPSTLRERID